MVSARLLVTIAAGAALLTSLGCASSNHSEEMAALQAENEELRAQVQAETGKQMHDILVVAISEYAAEHDRLPVRHSQLRDVFGDDGWKHFLSAADRTPEVMDEVATMDDPWAWVDENSSFMWIEGEVFDFDSPVLIERGGDLGQPRWVYFGDCHGELIAHDGAAWRRLELP